MPGFIRRLFTRHAGANTAASVRNVPPLPDNDEWFYPDSGLPYPRWKKIGNWVAENVEAEDFDEAYNIAVRLWLRRMAAAGGGGMRSAESPNFILLSPFEQTGRRWALKALENARRSIFEALGTLAWAQGWGKHLVLAMHPALYARYTAHYFSGDYMARSAGLMISGGGYTHIAAQASLTAREDSAFLRTLAHELTHNALCQLPLPRWLDEALAMSFEDQLGGGEPSIADRLGASFEAVGTRGLLRNFADWWTEEKMQGFWGGALWNSAEDEQSHCYEMARIIFRIIRQSVDGAPGRFRAFVGDADAMDGGQVAAKEHLGLSLGEVAADFLGEGDWEPQPVLW